MLGPFAWPGPPMTRVRYSTRSLYGGRFWEDSFHYRLLQLRVQEERRPSNNFRKPQTALKRSFFAIFLDAVKVSQKRMMLTISHHEAINTKTSIDTSALRANDQPPVRLSDLSFLYEARESYARSQALESSLNLVDEVNNIFSIVLDVLLRQK